MEFVTLQLIAIGLTFDTFAVSLSTGLAANQIRFRQATRVATVLAFFQALMPLLGWLIGCQIKHYISEYDHWVAFGLLSLIGLKMVHDSLKKEEDKKDMDPLKPALLIGMAIATSIDALVIGVSFSFLDVNIIFSTILIGVTTFIVAMLGMLCGKSAGQFFNSSKIDILGGLLLIGIGGKILFEHL